MTRTQTAAASLVAAIPAGLLAALLVMAFLNHAENLSTMVQALVGGTLLITAVVALMPFGVLLFGGRKAAVKTKDKSPAAESEATIATSDEIVASEEDEDTETVIYQTSEADDTGELADLDEFDTDDLGSDDMILSDDEIDVFEEDEDEPPKNKKKKR